MKVFVDDHEHYPNQHDKKSKAMNLPSSLLETQWKLSL